MREAPVTPPESEDEDMHPENDPTSSEDSWGEWPGDDYYDQDGNYRNAAEEHTAFRDADSGSTQY